MFTDRAAITAFLTQIAPLGKEELAAFFERAETVEYPSKAVVIEAQSTSADIHFVLEGYLKYVLETNDRKQVIHLAAPGDLVTDYISYLTGKPAITSLHTITDCRLLRISRFGMEQLFHRFKAWERFGRLLAEQGLVEQILQKIELQTKTKEEIYLRVIADQAHIFQHVRLADLAQTLGIAPETLSRIRKRVARR